MSPGAEVVQDLLPSPRASTHRLYKGPSELWALESQAHKQHTVRARKECTRI